jgi:8-oxo-dGTP pyrophosphatase MutT (NUDIX family)
MSFSDSYLGQLRKRIGSDLVLMPGSMVALRRPSDGHVLFTRRADDETWCLPAGAAEPGGSFAATAIGELKEEAGVTVAEDDLIPFATPSEAGLHTIIYPNGDETHCFAVCFLAERWHGNPRPDGEETTKIEFADHCDARSTPPRPFPCAFPRLGTIGRTSADTEVDERVVAAVDGDDSEVASEPAILLLRVLSRNRKTTEGLSSGLLVELGHDSPRSP